MPGRFGGPGTLGPRYSHHVLQIRAGVKPTKTRHENSGGRIRKRVQGKAASVISWADLQPGQEEASIELKTIIDDVTNLARMVKRRGGVLPFDCTDSTKMTEEHVRRALNVLGFSLTQRAGVTKTATVNVPSGASWSPEVRLEMASVRSQMVHVLFPCLEELNIWFGPGRGIVYLVRDVLRDRYHYGEVQGQRVTGRLLAPAGDARSTAQQKRVVLSVILPVLDTYVAVADFLLDIFEGGEEMEAKSLARQIQRCFIRCANNGSHVPALRELTPDVLALDSLENAINWCLQRWQSLPQILRQLKLAQQRCSYSECNAPVIQASTSCGSHKYSNGMLPFAGAISRFIGLRSEFCDS